MTWERERQKDAFVNLLERVGWEKIIGVIFVTKRRRIVIMER